MVNVGIKRLRHLRQKPTLSKENRASFSDGQWEGIRVKFIGQTTAGGIAFVLWFLACCSYLFGTLYNTPHRRDKFHVLAVDYDGHVVGQAMQAAYQQLKGPTFITLEFRSPVEFPTEQDMFNSVWNGKYWGAVSATEGASDRLSAALQGGHAAATYDPSGALHYIWNQQAYTTFANSIIQAGMQQLVAATRLAYNKINGTQASHYLNGTDNAAVQALLNPIQATATNIKAAPFGTVILFNTVAMAMPVLQQFFFLLVLNGAFRQHQLYNKMTVSSSLLIRRVAGALFTLGAALCQTGYFWAFREDWDIGAGDFFLTFLVFWLLMQIHLLILDSISTVAPLPVMPFVVLLWVFFNVASALSPLEMQAGFYHWGVALPSYNAYSVMVTIWTGGANNRLYRALPILFAWFLVGHVAISISHIRACHLSYGMEQEQRAGEDGSVKDEEGRLGSHDTNISGQTALDRVERRRTIEEAALEQRQVYGPSIPPFA